MVISVLFLGLGGGIKGRFLQKHWCLWDPPSLELGAKMTANGLSSYELFVKMSTFSWQKLNFPSVLGIFWKSYIRFYEKVIFWFDRVLGPFLMILCFYLCTPSGYYFFKIMTSWLILTSFCDFFDFLGPGPTGPGPTGPGPMGPAPTDTKCFYICSKKHVKMS